MLNIHKRGDDELPTENAQTSENQTEKTVETKKRSEKSVTVYVVMLFVVVLLLLFLSYFIQQRRNSDTISDLTEQHSAFSSQALQNIEKLQEKNLSLTKDLEDAHKQIEDLEEELDDSKSKLQDKIKEAIEAEMKNKEMEKKYQALDVLLDAEKVLESGDTEVAKKLIAALELIKDSLDEKYTARYQAMVENLS